MPEQACPDPPRKGGCRFDPATTLLDPEAAPPDCSRLTLRLSRPPAALLRLDGFRRVEVSWRADWAEWSLPERWTFFLEDLGPGEEDDLLTLEGEIARAARRGADHVLVSLSRQDPGPEDEYVHRLLGLIRNLCDEAGVSFATVPGLRVNPYLASANCCRWPKKG